MFVIIGLFLIMGILLAALSNKQLQQALLQKIVTQLEQDLGTKIKVESIDIHFFDKISLNNVLIEDLSKDTLFSAKSLTAKFNFFRLFGRILEINAVSVDSFYGNLRSDTTGHLNLDFIIERLKELPKNSTIVYKIKKISLNNSRFRYSNDNVPENDNGLFNAGKLYFSDINLDATINHLGNDSINGNINLLSCREQSGLFVKKIAFPFRGSSKGFFVENMAVDLSKSKLKISNLSASYNSLDDLSDFINKVKFAISIEPSELYFSDFSVFVPAFSPMKGKFSISSKFFGTVSNFKCQELHLSSNKSLSFDGDFDISGIPKQEDIYVYANIKSVLANRECVQDFISDLLRKPFVLPSELSQLGTMQYSGNISGFLRDLVVYGNLRTNIGKVSTDILINMMPKWSGVHFSGLVKTSEFQLGKLLGEASNVGNVSLELSVTGQKEAYKALNGELNGMIHSFAFNNYNYENVMLKGEFNGSFYDGTVSMNDENAKVAFNGMLDLSNKNNPVSNFSASLHNVNLHRLNLIKKYPEMSFSLDLTSKIEGGIEDNAKGNISIGNIHIQNAQKSVLIKRFDIIAEKGDSIGGLEIHSDLLSGKLRGSYSITNLLQSVERTLSNYLLSLFKTNYAKIPRENNFVFSFSKFNLNQIADVLDIPLRLDKGASINGYYNDEYNKFRVECIFPYIEWGKTKLENTNLLCQTQDDAIVLSVQSGMINARDKIRFQIGSTAKDNNVEFGLNWCNSDSLFHGGLKLNSNFYREDNTLYADVNFHPSQLYLLNTAWDLQQSNILTDMKTVQINNFALESASQYIKINGTLSDNANDSIHVQLNQVRLQEMLDLIPLREPRLDASVSGRVIVRSAFKNMVMMGRIDADDFRFNGMPWGDVRARANWDTDKKRLVMRARSFEGKDTLVAMSGYYYPPSDSLELNATAYNLPIQFLRRWTDNVVQNIDGKGSGKMRLSVVRKKLAIEGDFAVKDGSIDVDFLKTTYFFSDSVHLRKNEVLFRNVTAYDKENNKATVNGRLTHNGKFKDLKHNISISCKNILALNTKEQDNSAFYGKAYATGTVQISGNPQETLISVNAKPEPDTKIFIPLAGTITATETNFISFKNNADTSKIKNEITTQATHANIKLNAIFDVTPDAEITLITDPIGKDYISAVGSGNFRIDYDPNGELKLFGKYEIESGKYFFTLQQIRSWNFIIQNGSSIMFNGDPYTATVDINAKYAISSVSLLDILDKNELTGPTSVPVNCLLNLTGDIMQPTIKFDIELTDEELLRKVKNAVNTDELMNRQMIYLLTMKRFYTPDNMQLNSSTGANEAFAIFSTTVSGQLNSWLSQISDNINIGFNYGLDDVSRPQETGRYEVDLEYKPTKRLIINGKVGYREEEIAGTKFIGDFDIEYKLTSSGKYRLKAYTHTNDNYSLRTAPYTQGIGLVYKEDFDSFGTLMKSYRDAAVLRKQKKELKKENKQKNKQK